MTSDIIRKNALTYEISEFLLVIFSLLSALTNGSEQVAKQIETESPNNHIRVLHVSVST